MCNTLVILYHFIRHESRNSENADMVKASKQIKGFLMFLICGVSEMWRSV